MPLVLINELYIVVNPEKTFFLFFLGNLVGNGSDHTDFTLNMN